MSKKNKNTSFKSKILSPSIIEEKPAIESNPIINPIKSADASIVSKSSMPFDRINYMIMMGGIVLLIIGLIIMASDKETFGFGFLGLTLGPIIVFLSFMIQFVAILYRPRKS
jgi:uncharacterized integral membrane protein